MPDNPNAGISYPVLGGPHESGNEAVSTGGADADLAVQAARGAASDASGAATTATSQAQAAAGSAAQAAGSATAAAASATSAASQVGVVTGAGSTQVSAINAAGTAQVAAVTAAGQSSVDDAAASAADAVFSDQDAQAQAAAALASAQLVQGLIGMTLLQPVLYVPDPSAAPRSGLLLASDFGLMLVTQQGSGQTLTLPLNLNRQLWQGSSPSAAWVRLVNGGTGNITIAAAGGSGPVQPSTIAEQIPGPGEGLASTGSDYVKSYALAVPAGTGRYLHVQTASHYDAGDAGRNTRLAAVGTVSGSLVVTKVSGDLATQAYNTATGATLDGASFIAPIPDGPAETINLTLTYSKNLIAHLARLAAVGNAGGYSGQVAFSDTAAADNTVSVGTTIPSGGALFRGLLCQSKGASSPATLAGATLDSGGVTPVPPDGLNGKRIAFLAAEKWFGTAGSVSISGTFAAANKGMGMGVVFTPGAGASSVTILHLRSLTVQPGEAVVIDALSDGVTYVVS